MAPTYGYYHQSFAEPVLFGLLMIWSIAAVIGVLIGLTIWAFKSWSLYQITRRRGLENAWLSWVPMGRDWMIGSVSDQYQYLVHGKIRHLRKILLGCSIASFVSTAITVILTIVFVTGISVSGFMYSGYGYYWAMQGTGMALMMMLSLVLGIVAFVFRCICKYDLYRSCEPQNAVAYLVLGILFGILDPIFMWICRNKDLGMPPRKPEYTASAQQEKTFL